MRKNAEREHLPDMTGEFIHPYTLNTVSADMEMWTEENFTRPHTKMKSCKQSIAATGEQICSLQG